MGVGRGAFVNFVTERGDVYEKLNTIFGALGRIKDKETCMKRSNLHSVSHKFSN